MHARGNTGSGRPGATGLATGLDLDLLGAVVAHVVFVSSILTFTARLALDVRPGHWVGVPLLLMAFPLAFLLITARRANRPPLYYIQVGVMLVWIVVLFLLDYVYQTEWRNNQWVVIPFVMAYFGGLGGMIGVASLAGRRWTVSSVVLFSIAAVLAFVQRAVTGL